MVSKIKDLLIKFGTKNRKIVLINPKFQLRMMAYGVLLSILILLVFLGFNYLLLEQVKEIGGSLGFASEHVFYQSLELVFQWHQNMVISFALLVIGLVLIFVLYFSHKIAGPIYNLTNYLKRVSEGGENKAIKFRDGDFFPEIADALNEALKKKGSDN